MPYDFRQVRCLICDDSPQMRRLVEALLREIGLTDTHLAKDGHDCWEKVASVKPHLLILDWNLGAGRGSDSDGLALVEQLRRSKQSPNRYLPIMLLTGYTEAHRVKRAQNAGIHDLVAKPVTAATLYKHLYRMVEDDRDFVVTTSFFGPDRRRSNAPPPPDGKERRAGESAEEGS